jgi:hypothetical protein
MLRKFRGLAEYFTVEGGSHGVSSSCSSDQPVGFNGMNL